eukprot:c20308_g1_i1.p1 GENE.c20308_g1_i1~~c20308_g1_i1.p1  ORF type:complete len:284 (+),score=72.44 c20308_g1_i1:54-905(+)
MMLATFTVMQEVVKEIIKEVVVDKNEIDFNNAQPKLCKLLELSKVQQIMLLGRKGSGKSSMLKHMFDIKEAEPVQSVHDGTREFTVLHNTFIDTVGAEVSFSSISKLLVASMASLRTFPRAFILVHPDDRFYIAGLNELLYTGSVDLYLNPIDWRRFNSEIVEAEEAREEFDKPKVMKKCIVKLVYNYLKDDPHLKLLINKSDFQSNMTTGSVLYGRLQTFCRLPYSKYKQMFEGGEFDAVGLIFGGMLDYVNSNYIDTQLRMDPILVRSFINDNAFRSRLEL